MPEHEVAKETAVDAPLTGLAGATTESSRPSHPPRTITTAPSNETLDGSVIAAASNADRPSSAPAQPARDLTVAADAAAPDALSETHRLVMEFLKTKGLESTAKTFMEELGSAAAPASTVGDSRLEALVAITSRLMGPRTESDEVVSPQNVPMTATAWDDRTKVEEDEAGVDQSLRRSFGGLTVDNNTTQSAGDGEEDGASENGDFSYGGHDAHSASSGALGEVDEALVQHVTAGVADMDNQLFGAADRMAAPLTDAPREPEQFQGPGAGCLDAHAQGSSGSIALTDAQNPFGVAAPEGDGEAEARDQQHHVNDPRAPLPSSSHFPATYGMQHSHSHSHSRTTQGHTVHGRPLSHSDPQPLGMGVEHFGTAFGVSAFGPPPKKDTTVNIDFVVSETESDEDDEWSSDEDLGYRVIPLAEDNMSDGYSEEGDAQGEGEDEELDQCYNYDQNTAEAHTFEGVDQEEEEEYTYLDGPELYRDQFAEQTTTAASLSPAAGAKKAAGVGVGVGGGGGNLSGGGEAPISAHSSSEAPSTHAITAFGESAAVVGAVADTVDSTGGDVAVSGVDDPSHSAASIESPSASELKPEVASMSALGVCEDADYESIVANAGGRTQQRKSSAEVDDDGSSQSFETAQETQRALEDGSMDAKPNSTMAASSLIPPRATTQAGQNAPFSRTEANRLVKEAPTTSADSSLAAAEEEGEPAGDMSPSAVNLSGDTVHASSDGDLSARQEPSSEPLSASGGQHLGPVVDVDVPVDVDVDVDGAAVQEGVGATLTSSSANIASEALGEGQMSASNSYVDQCGASGGDGESRQRANTPSTEDSYKPNEGDLQKGLANLLKRYEHFGESKSDLYSLDGQSTAEEDELSQQEGDSRQDAQDESQSQSQADARDETVVHASASDHETDATFETYPNDAYPQAPPPCTYDCMSLKVIYQRSHTGFEESKDYPIDIHSVIAGRYQILEYLGSAAFSRAVQCLDLNTGMLVCVKIIKNNKDFFDQSLDEVKLLRHLNEHADCDQVNVLNMYDYFYYKEHLFIVCELLRDNLYEFSKYNREVGGDNYFTIPRLQKITLQVLTALEYIHSLDLLHCDLKPENILIKSYSRCEVKVIDFGSSCFIHDHLSSYVQSRSYRAPEVILGLPYNKKIDMWSLGCILAELLTGHVLFVNDSVQTLLARVNAIIGPFDKAMLAKGRFTHKFFTKNGLLFEQTKDSTYHFLYPKKTSLRKRLKCNDSLFVNFLKYLLKLNPAERPTASEALQHPWLKVQYDHDDFPH